MDTIPVKLFESNNIIVTNTIEYEFHLLVSEETHKYVISNNELFYNESKRYIVKSGKKDPETVEINIYGIKSYVSLFINSKEHKMGNIFENRLFHKGDILNIDHTHVSTFLSKCKNNNETYSIVDGSAQIPDTYVSPQQNRKIQSEKLKRILNEYPQKEYLKSKYLGSGAYGRVYLATLDNEFVAVKRFNIEKDATDDKYLNNLKKFFKEIKILKRLDHPNIVKYKYACVNSKNGTPKYINIFLEYCSGGTIADILDHKDQLIPESTVSKYTKQILLALRYLHENEIIHRDIKGSNILIDQFGVIKLADFGCSKYFEGMSISSSINGTEFFIAPEVLKREYGRPSDIWSLGCTIIQMITRKTPEIIKTYVELDFLKSGPINIPSNISEILIDFLGKCFQLDPKKRSTAEELLNHIFITEYNS